MVSTVRIVSAYLRQNRIFLSSLGFLHVETMNLVCPTMLLKLIVVGQVAGK